MAPRLRSALWPAVFALCVLGFGARSVALGQDANWDLKNYHWYNAYALLNGRIGWDVAPAQIQTYYNPLGELPFWWLVHALPGEPRAVAFAMALPAAIAAFFLLRILALLFPVGRERGALVWIAAAAAIGLTGAAGQSTLGSTMNEWPSTALVMAGVWLALRAPDSRRGECAAAFLVGCAMGLKLTFATFGVAFLVALAVRGTTARRLGLAMLGLTAGFLLLGGYWCWVMWREFANPVFPYFNTVFRSPWWEPTAFFDPARGPRTPMQWLFLPFYFGVKSSLVSEVGFRDYRLPALYVVGALAAIKAIAVRPARDAAWMFLAAFAASAYLAWLFVFAIFRYLVPLEILSGALLVGGIRFLLRDLSPRYVAAGVLTVLLIGTTRPMSWGRMPFADKYFDIRVPPVEANSLVIVGYVHPLSYLIPSFPPDTRFVSPANNFMLLDQRNLLEKRAAETIANHRGPIYLLEHRTRLPQDTWTAQRFALDIGECEFVTAPMSGNEVRLCRMTRRREGSIRMPSPPGRKQEAHAVDSHSWARKVEEASSTDAVVALVRDYIASRDGQEMKRLPRECSPPQQISREQIADFAYRLAAYHGHDDDARLVQRLSSVVSRAAVRLAELERRGDR